MNDTKESIFRIGTAVSAVSAVVSAVLYAIAYKNSYDLSIRHFNPSITVTVFCILAALSVLSSTVSAILLRKSGKMTEHAPNYIESFILWMTAFMFIGFGFISLTTPASSTVSTSLADSSNGFSILSNVCSSAILPLTFISALPFICAASDKLRGCMIHSLTSFAPVLWGLCLLLKYYFDLKDMTLNDPELSITSLILSAIVIFLLSESRSTLNINTPSVYFFGSITALTVTGCFTTARIILSLTSGHAVPSLMENIIFFMISALALTRLISFESKVTPAEQNVPPTDTLRSEDDPAESEGEAKDAPSASPETADPGEAI